ncbi:MAG TPA: EAL domain-containing protein [Solirubrobacteraceae bacterium]|nr:EAL domain-containing protein [Solirubrobacteraceae bacterium]
MFRQSANVLVFEPSVGGGSARAKRRALRQARRGVDATAILESLEPAVVGQGVDGVIGMWTSGAERLYGYSADEMLGHTLEAVVPSTRRSWEAEMLRVAVRAGLSDSYETVRLCKDGSTMPVRVQFSPIRDAERAIVGVSRIESAVADNERRSTPIGEGLLRSSFEDAPIGIALVSIEASSEGCVLRANRALCELTGHSPKELATANVHELIHPDDAATDRAAMARLHAAEIDHFHLEQRMLHSERHVVWVAVDVSLGRDAAGRPLYCIRQLQDIEERKRYEAELGYLVEHDPLTGLLNRSGFIRELTHEMAYAHRYGGDGAVLLLDLDDFKFVNDTRGHAAGDEVLSEVGRIIGERLRETDVFARLSGDEFAVLLPRTAPRDAQRLAEGLLDAVRDECRLTPAGEGGISLSIGVGGFEERGMGQNAEDILVEADDAMYLAKEAGKGRVAVASAATRRTKARVTWAERVAQAVHEGLFELYCQPIVDFASDAVARWELLLRLPGDNGELILPSQFLYTAERSGLILEIDRWVLGEALVLIAAQTAAGREICLEVNISGRSVGDPQLLSLIEEALDRTAIDPASLIFEVTETAAIANMDRARGFATTLQSLGCGFALDDFGAGFGSFYYLKHIPFDYVKIDGEFIRNLPASSTDRLIVDSIVQMSKGLGKHTIAEFVGNQETVEVLKEHGVDFGQGYHLGRPIPMSEALAV